MFSSFPIEKKVDDNDDNDNDDTHQGWIIVHNGKYSVADKNQQIVKTSIN